MFRPDRVMLVLFITACGGKIDGGSLDDAGSDGSVSDAGIKPPIVDAAIFDVTVPNGQCNALPQLGSQTPLIQVADNAPPLPASSAPLLDGVYVLASITSYTGPGGATGSLYALAETIQLSGGLTLVNTVVDAPNQAETRGTGTLVVSGTTLESVPTCPMAGEGGMGTFAFDGSKLLLREGTGALDVDQVYVRVTP